MSGPIFPGPRRWRGPDYRIRIVPGDPKPVARMVHVYVYERVIRVLFFCNAVAAIVTWTIGAPVVAQRMSIGLWMASAVLVLIDEVRHP